MPRKTIFCLKWYAKQIQLVSYWLEMPQEIKIKKSIEFFTQRPLSEEEEKTIKSLIKCHCQLKINKENKMTPNWNTTIKAFSLSLLLLLLPLKITLLGTEYKYWFHILLRLHRQKRISNYSNTSEEKKMLNYGFMERICSLKPFWLGHCLCSCFVSVPSNAGCQVWV